MKKLILLLALALCASAQNRLARVAAPSRRAGETKVNAKDGLTWVWIPPGTFTMGCSPGDDQCFADEKPAHRVLPWFRGWGAAERPRRVPLRGRINR